MSRRPAHLESLVPCPSVDPVLLDDGTLLFVAMRGGTRQRLEPPWGRMVHEVAVRGRPLADCVAAADRQPFEELLRRLAADGVLIPRQRLHARDTAPFDRQVRWFAQEGVDGPLAQRRLTAARVLVVGVAGIGSVVAEALARAGVGSLALVDCARVQQLDLHHQALYDERDVAVRKAFAAANQLERIAPALHVVPVELDIDRAADITRLLRRFRPDLVVCAATGEQLRAAVDDAAFAAGIAVLHAAARAPLAVVGPLLVPGSTSCHACHRAAADDAGAALGVAVLERAAEAVSASPAVCWNDMTVGALAAGQVVAWLTGIHEPAVLGRSWELDLRTLQSVRSDAPSPRACERCAVQADAPS